MFVFVSDRPSLDFLGTRKWRHNRPEEQLQSPADLRTWAAQARLVNADLSMDDAGLRRAVEVREAIHRVVIAQLAGVRPGTADVRLVNAAARPAPVTLALTAAGQVSRKAGLDALLSTLTRDALDLLGGPDAARLRECADARCTRLFVDASRAGSRRWCGMAECGNKAKVAAFRERRARHDQSPA